MLCSIDSSVTILITSTERIWFLRQARAIRCSSLAGFHGRSTLIDGAGDLEVEPDAAAVGGQKQPAGRVMLEAVDLGAAALLGQRSGVPGDLDAHLAGQFADHDQHPLPFGEHDDLAVGLGEQSPSTASSSSSLGLIRQVGSRIAGVSQTMRMQASSICRRSNSAW